MPKSWRFTAVLAALSALALAAPAFALEECRLMRMPAIGGGQIVFVYGGDLWKVPRTGGTAIRLTSSPAEQRFPKISPDGRTVAFTGDYEGNVDAYTLPIEGGEPTRLTFHPGADNVAAWYPDGRSLLIRSARVSAPTRYDRFFRIAAGGGFEQLLPLPTAGYASFNADGSKLAFVSPSYDNRTWKRYKGGNAPDIWVYDFKNNTSEKITDWVGCDEWPMWVGNTIYYCSDREGRRANIWAFDTEKKTHRQVTTFKDYDVKWPSASADGMVFENGGYLYVMDLPTEKTEKIRVWVPDDKPGTRAQLRNVSAFIGGGDLSPSAKRAVFEARGELFTVPAEKGDPRNLTHSPGVRERAPEWSPDGKWIAYFSDRSGEYQVHVIGGDGKTPERQVTHDLRMYPFELRWSPDSKKIALSDRTRSVYVVDVASGSVKKADQSTNGEIHDYAWSPDSKWLAYSKNLQNGFSPIFLYSLETGVATQVTDGMTNDGWPAWDPEGKYLYFASSRTLNPALGGFELNFQFYNMDGLYVVTLRDSLPSPVAPQSDEETGEPAAGGKDAGAKGKDAGKDAAKGAAAAAPAPVRVTLKGIGERVTALPVKPGTYSRLVAFKGKLLYSAQNERNDDGAPTGPANLRYFDFDKREEKTVISGIQGWAPSKDGGKVLYKAGPQYGIIDVAENKKPGDGKIETGTLMTMVDPRLEWRQMFDEASRLERDFYYDPNMGGLDWKAVSEQYRQLIPYAAHRSDVNYILGEFIGELSTSHSYVQGGDFPKLPRVGVGLLGADFELDAASGLYRFKRIYRDRDWNSNHRAPLGEPGVMVNEGDYLISVNGLPVKSPMNVYSAFQGTVDQQVQLTVASTPLGTPRSYTVKPSDEESSLRYTAWVRANREKVAAATGGKVAYVHVPNTAIEGIQEFSKQYYPQTDRQALIVDERFNGGGFIPDFFVERLSRRIISYGTGRDNDDFKISTSAMDGPKCMLINQYAGSGGDAFPYYFRMKGLGPIIGKRTWGGLVGISHGIGLVDGGSVTMPEFGMWDPTAGKWMAENHGVDPDTEVENTPESMVSGHDLQLEKAIQYCMDELKAHPVVKPTHPAYPVQPK